MFQPASLQALARSLQILSDPRGASDLYDVWAARRASAIDAKFTAMRRASSRVNRFGRPAVRRSDTSGLGGRSGSVRLALETTLMTHNDLGLKQGRC